MSARLDAALRIFEREHARLWAWASGFVSDQSADQVTAYAFTTMMWHGANGGHTSSGTIPGLYKAADAALRRAVETRGGYLAANAWKHAPWPTYAEALELSQLYCAWVYLNIAADLGWNERLVFASALKRYRTGRMLIPTGDKTAAEDALIMSTLRLAASYLEPTAPQVSNAADKAREVWQRERYRTATTYRSLGHLKGGAADGEEQQTDHPHHTSPPDGDDHLAGLWRLRDAEPQHVLGGADEPAAH